MSKTRQQDENLNTVLKVVNTLSPDEIAETYQLAHELLKAVEHKKTGALALTLATAVLVAYP